jgi:hypothetical protein
MAIKQVTKSEIDTSIKELLKALEVGMYTHHPTPHKKLCGFLEKLGIKSAKAALPILTVGAALQMESLEATLRSITFEEDQIKFWKDKVK